jgi:VWFA-related protein
MLRRISLAGFFFGVASAAALQTPDPQTATFHAGTRLVEVEVVVRGKQGPIAGLKKDDFTVLDQGKPQRIDVFRAGQASSAAGTATPAAPLPPGAVSNRVDHLGKTLPNATVVLFDQLNTRFDLKAYASKGMLDLIRGLGSRDRTAIYSLGRNLHVLQDFTDDPAKLLAAVAHLDSGRDLMPANFLDAMMDLPTEDEGPSGRVASRAVREMYAKSIGDLAGTTAMVNAATNDSITEEALRLIAQHLSGMPGRRSLVWLMNGPFVPPAVMGMLMQADIHLYPVLIRTVEYGSMAFAPDFMQTQRAGRALAAMTGGASFDDAADMKLALKTAEEDSETAYTLGYYPSEDLLDGTYHRLTVSVAGEKSAHFEVRYRPGYLATKQEVARVVPSLRDALAELLANPLDTTAIGITAQFRPDPAQTGLYDVRVTVDLHDVHLEREGDRSLGKIEMAFPFGEKVRLRTVNLDLTDDQLAEVLKTGFVMVTNGIEAAGDAIRVVVRDPSTGVAGSLRIPLHLH